MVDKFYFVVCTLMMCGCFFFAGVEFAAWVHLRAKEEKARNKEK